MSRRSALTGIDREAFIKAQIASVYKALNKNEMPLKQKHVRVLIVGTHKEKSSALFWDTISRIQLEKNPIVSWKFCHLLHKLIRDGHPKIVEETQRYTQRIVQLGNFWQHLLTTGYGLANSTYCKLLVNRLAFLKRNHLFPGSLHLSETQINTLVNSDVNLNFEVAIEMLDQMDDLLNLQSIVFEAMGVVRWNSLSQQGQCLLAPLILVIVDASKFYDYLVKVIFRLHGQIPADALAGHRERFNIIFRKIKKFFEMASNLQYFKYLVTIPDLPDQAPNFLRASDLDVYQTPQAVLHSDDVSECDSPPDGMSVADESLVDITAPAPNMQAEDLQKSSTDDKDLMIETLRKDLADARLNQTRLMNEARSRIEQYENRLMQMKDENDHYMQTVDELKREVDRLQAVSVLNERRAVDEMQLQDAEKRAQDNEQNFMKMKTAYARLRIEHIQALTKLSNAQKDLTASETEMTNKVEVINNLERKLAEIEHERSLVEEKARGAATSVGDLQGQLAKCQVEIEALNKKLDETNLSTTKEIEGLKAKNSELSVALAESERERKIVEEKARCSNDAADSLSVQLSKYVAEIELLKKKLKDMEEKGTRDLFEFTEKWNALELKISEEECKRHAADKQIENLVEQRGDLSGQLAQSMAELGTLKETNMQLKKRLDISVVDCCTLRQTLNNVEDECKSKVSALNEANQELLGKLEEERRNYAILQDSMKKCIGSESTLKTTLEQCLKEIEMLSNDNKRLAKKFELSTRDLLLLKKNFEELKESNRKEADELLAEKGEVEMKLLEETQQKRNLEKDFRYSVENEKVLSDKLKRCLEQIALLQRKEIDLKEKLKIAYNQCLSYKKTIESRELEATQKIQEAQLNFEARLQASQSKLFEFTCKAIEDFLLRSRDDLQNASSISFPIQLALPAMRNDVELLKKLTPLVKNEPTPELINALVLFNHGVADTVMNAAAAAYTVSIQHFEPVHEQCRNVAVDALDVIGALKLSDYAATSSVRLPKLLSSLEKLEELCLKLPASSDDISTEELGALLEDEMRRMDKAIETALRMLEEMQEKSRATQSGIRLEVNNKILVSCNALMAAIILLVTKSRAMQEEIVALGRGTASPNEFYKRHHQWTEGLLSAAKAVGAGANVLVQAADGVVTGKGKLEFLIVASQEIAASTAQLFVSSRVKADRGSKRLTELATASKNVNVCTADVVATVKSGLQTLTDAQNLDFSHLSLHEAKKEEMESQVRTLELEAELMRERARFAGLRKQHYHLASLVANENGS